MKAAADVFSQPQTHEMRMKRVKPQAPLVDLMDGDLRRELPVHDKGMVALVDCMPRMAPPGRTGDYAIAQMARTSYGPGTKSLRDDRGLIRYLMRRWHTSPFEGVEFKFHMKMPIFIARQIVRHRTASLNEVSARYSQLPDTFFVPRVEDLREQKGRNKQGSEGQFDEVDAELFLERLERRCRQAYADYEDALNRGLAREQARMQLPINIYTEWYWKMDLHNLFHFLWLRLDPHAQQETRDYAQAVWRLIQPIVPEACRAFEDYRTNAVHLTGLEVEALRKTLAMLMGRIEQLEHVKADLRRQARRDPADAFAQTLERMLGGDTAIGPAPVQTESEGEQAEWLEKAAELGLVAPASS